MHSGTRPMRWAAVAPFFTRPDSLWLDRFVTSPKHQVDVVCRPDSTSVDWHARRTPTTGAAEWLTMHRHVGRAWTSQTDGIITVFPQLAAIAGARKWLTRSKRPIVAWCLNIGRLYTGARRTLARMALKSIDYFVVHSRRECENYSEWYGLPRDRFEFVPLQRGFVEPTVGEEQQSPFILAMGSAHRDYRTLFEAVRPLGIRTVVVASPRYLDGLDVPSCVEFRTGLSHEECSRLAQQARLNIVPISNEETASGQVTVVEAMWLARTVIATRCVGTEDYIDSESDGYLVPRAQVEPLRERIRELWDDEALRTRIGRAARERASACFSDQMAGTALTRILDRFAG